MSSLLLGLILESLVSFHEERCGSASLVAAKFSFAPVLSLLVPDTVATGREKNIIVVYVSNARTISYYINELICTTIILSLK